MNKFNVKSIAKHNWPILIFVPFIMLIGWIILGKALASPTIDQRLEILISTDKVSVIDFQKKMNELKDDYIYKINLTCYNEESEAFPMFYSAAASSQDFMILSSNFLNDSSLPNLMTNYSVIDKEYLEEKLERSDLDYLSKDGVNYAFKVYNKNTKNSFFNSYISYNKEYDYYLVFGKNSHHIGQLNNSKSLAALNLLKALMEL